MFVTSTRREALLLTSLVIVSQLSFLVSTSAENQLRSRRRLQRPRHDDTGAMSYGYRTKTAAAAKRSNSGMGTCTCTCETKPVSAAEHQQKSKPNSASLIRTAAHKHSAESQQGTAMDEAASAAETGEEGFNAPTNEQNPKTPASQNSDESLSSAANELPQTLSNALETQQLINGDQDRWGHGSRYPWKRLPDTMCFRQSCSTDGDCCLRYNLCDQSAHVCVDCWYGSTCTSERDCCLRHPYCERQWGTSPIDGRRYVVSGKCVGEM